MVRNPNDRVRKVGGGASAPNERGTKKVAKKKSKKKRLLE